jgi:hypothetical protein
MRASALIIAAALLFGSFTGAGIGCSPAAQPVVLNV